jgi:hypothetical protein
VNKLGFENSHIHEMVTAGGKLYVLDNMSTIHVTTESGEPINHFSSDGMTMAVGGDGTIYAGVRKGIVAYSEMGASLRQMDCNGVVTHIEVDKESGDVYAAVLNEGIRKFSGADESMFSTMSTHSTPLFALSSSYLYVYGKREACITLHCKKTLMLHAFKRAVVPCPAPIAHVHANATFRRETVDISRQLEQRTRAFRVPRVEVVDISIVCTLVDCCFRFGPCVEGLQLLIVKKRVSHHCWRKVEVEVVDGPVLH